MPLPNLEKLRVKRCGEVREAILSYELIMHLVRARTMPMVTVSQKIGSLSTKLSFALSLTSTSCRTCLLLIAGAKILFAVLSRLSLEDAMEIIEGFCNWLIKLTCSAASEYTTSIAGRFKEIRGLIVSTR